MPAFGAAAIGDRVQIFEDPLTEHTPQGEAEVVQRIRLLPGRYLRTRAGGKTWGHLGLYKVRFTAAGEGDNIRQRTIFEPFEA